jgi:hypothetical protein
MSIRAPVAIRPAASDPPPDPLPALLAEVAAVAHELRDPAPDDRDIRCLASVDSGHTTADTLTTQRAECPAFGTGKDYRTGPQLAVSHSTATGIVRRLEDRGLVQRNQHLSDRRVMLLSLTAHGQDVVEHTPPEHRLSVLLDAWTAAPRDDRALILNGVTTLRRLLESRAPTAGARSRVHQSTVGDPKGDADPTARATADRAEAEHAGEARREGTGHRSGMADEE